MKNRFSSLGVITCNVAVFLTLHGSVIGADVEAFVTKLYRHGLPYSEALKFTPSNCSELIRILKDEPRKHAWVNVVSTLGIIGDDSAVEALIEFLENRFSGDIDHATFEALLDVPRALGHSAAKGNARALDYLLASHRIEDWVRKPLRWKFQTYQDEKLAILMTKLTMQGLAISCSPRAKDLLILMRDSPDYSQIRAKAEVNIREAIEFLNRLETQGHLKVFGAAH